MAQLVLTKHQAQTRPYCFHPLGEHSHLTLTHPFLTQNLQGYWRWFQLSLIANRFCSPKGLNSCHVLCMILADTKSCRDASSLLKTHLLINEQIWEDGQLKPRWCAYTYKRKRSSRDMNLGTVSIYCSVYDLGQSDRILSRQQLLMTLRVWWHWATGAQALEQRMTMYVHHPWTWLNSLDLLEIELCLWIVHITILCCHAWAPAACSLIGFQSTQYKSWLDLSTFFTCYINFQLVHMCVSKALIIGQVMWLKLV